MVARSFAAFKRRQQGDDDWVQSRIDAVHEVRTKLDTQVGTIGWQDRLSASIGFSPRFVRELADAFASGWSHEASVIDWKTWYVDWLSARSDWLPKLIRNETLESFLGTSYKKLEDDQSRGEMICNRVFALLEIWMSGRPLAEIELAMGTKPKLLKTCEGARDFVSDIIPELSYLFGTPSLVTQAMIDEGIFEDEAPLSLSLLSVCVKEGFDSSEKAVLRTSMNGIVNRRAVHREYDALAPHLPPISGVEDFSSILNRLNSAKAIKLFI